MNHLHNRILVTGATGAIGKRVVKKLVSQGYRVAGLTTSEKGAKLLEALNATPYVGNIYDEEFVDSMVSDFQPEIIIHQITDLKSMSGAANSLIRKAGTHSLINAALSNRVKKIISQSISWAYEAGTTLADESTPLDLGANEPRKTTIDGIVALEEKTKEMADYVILRYGTLYGKDTWYDVQGEIYQTFKAGNGQISNGTLSFIHIDDAVNAAVQAINWPTGVYNIVDDEPTAGDKWSEFYSNRLGVALPVLITEKFGWERGASNQKFKRVGGILIYPSWRQGMKYLD